MKTDRKSEIRRLLQLSPEEVVKRAGDRLLVCADLDALHRRLADDIAGEGRAGHSEGRPVRLILPVGPTGQYPILADIINRERLSLARCWFFFMDEYCGPDARAIGPDHPLSFRGKARREFFDRLCDGHDLREGQVVFPDENNISALADRIRSVGGIDACYGGIGIHGHVAFNEPEPGIKQEGPRRVLLNDYTVTINAVRAHVGGNIECFPREAFTLGMREVLSARRIRLCCRNGCEFDWANTVLRLALFGTPGDDYPATHIRDHEYRIFTDKDTLASPEFLL